MILARIMLRVTVVGAALITLVAMMSLTAPDSRAQEGKLELISFTIDPPYASPGGMARIRFEFRGAAGGLVSAQLLARPASGTWRRSLFEDAVNRAITALGPLERGTVEAIAQHAARYAPEQRGTSNEYELRLVDRTGRKSNALTVSLPVRM